MRALKDYETASVSDGTMLYDCAIRGITDGAT